MGTQGFVIVFATAVTPSEPLPQMMNDAIFVPLSSLFFLLTFAQCSVALAFMPALYLCNVAIFMFTGHPYSSYSRSFSVIFVAPRCRSCTSASRGALWRLCRPPRSPATIRTNGYSVPVPVQLLSILLTPKICYDTHTLCPCSSCLFYSLRKIKCTNK